MRRMRRLNAEQLNKIVAIANKAAILRELKSLGYRNCAQSKKYRDFPLPAIFRGKELSTEWVSNAFDDREYKGYTFTDVEGAEQTEFFVLEVNAIDRRRDVSRPLSMHIWFKE